MLNKGNSSYPENSIGKTKSDELLSANEKDNEDLWAEKNKEFFGLAVAPAEELFKRLYEENRDKDNQGKLREKCEEVYKTIPNSGQEGNNISAEDAVKYCSMKLISR